MQSASINFFRLFVISLLIALSVLLTSASLSSATYLAQCGIFEIPDKLPPLQSITNALNSLGEYSFANAKNIVCINVDLPVPDEPYTPRCPSLMKSIL